MAKNEQSLSDDLRELADNQDATLQSRLAYLADRAQDVERLLDSMHSFIESEYRAEFEDTLDYEEQQLYREHFSLSHEDDWDLSNGFGEDEPEDMGPDFDMFGPD